MKIEIGMNPAVVISDVIARSPVAGIAGASKTLQEFIQRSILHYVGTVDGKTACMFGLIAPSLMSSQAYLWLLTTDLVDEHQFIFVRRSQLVIKQLLKDFPVIVGHVAPDNERGKRWLRWLGAEIGSPEHGRMPFTIKA